MKSCSKRNVDMGIGHPSGIFVDHQPLGIAWSPIALKRQHNSIFSFVWSVIREWNEYNVNYEIIIIILQGFLDASY